MLLNLSWDVEQLLKDVVEVFGNRSGPGRLFEQLFDAQTQEQRSFICNDDIHVLSVHPPKAADLAKWDSGESDGSMSECVGSAVDADAVCVCVCHRSGDAARGGSAAAGLARPAVGANGSKSESAGLAQAALPSPHARDLQTGHQRTGIHLPAGPGGAFTALASSTEEGVGRVKQEQVCRQCLLLSVCAEVHSCLMIVSGCCCK